MFSDRSISKGEMASVNPISPRPAKVGHQDNSARRQRGTKEAGRERLLRAVIEIVSQRGVDALTTVGITDAAGFAQSSFYLHFKNVEECLYAATARIAEESRLFIAQHRRLTHEAASTDPTAPIAHLRAVLQLFLDQRHFSKLLFRYRHDPSPVGEVMRQMFEAVRGDLITDSWSVAQSFGVPSQCYSQVALTAEFIHGLVMAAGEALLDGRFTDLNMVAAELSATIDATTRAALERCLANR